MRHYLTSIILIALTQIMLGLPALSAAPLSAEELQELVVMVEEWEESRSAILIEPALCCIFRSQELAGYNHPTEFALNEPDFVQSITFAYWSPDLVVGPFYWPRLRIICELHSVALC